MDRDSRRRKGTWSTEANGPDFRGASDSVIEGHRPNIALDPGRKSNWPFVLGAFVLVVGGAVGASIYFWDDIQNAAANFGSDDAEGTTGEASTETGDETGENSESSETGATAPTGSPSPTGATGPTGAPAPTGTSAAPAPSGAAGSTTGDAPPHAWPPPGDQRFPADDAGDATSTTGAPAPTGAADSGTSTSGGTPPPAATPSVTVEELRISGISRSRAEAKLGDLAALTTACLADTGGGVSKGELSIRMTIKWNGRPSGISATGAGLPSALTSCVRSKIPKSGYPAPKPGKDGVIRAKLRIGT